ncbi:hypothetical protein ABVT39_027349 [Epinephelus coioides]
MLLTLRASRPAPPLRLRPRLRPPGVSPWLRLPRVRLRLLLPRARPRWRPRLRPPRARPRWRPRRRPRLRPPRVRPRRRIKRWFVFLLMCALIFLDYSVVRQRIRLRAQLQQT